MGKVQYFAYACSLVLSLASVNSSNAQIFGKPKYEFGVNAGTFIYQGDLTPSALGSYRTMKPGIGIHATRILSRFLAVRANLNIAGLSGDDSKYEYPAYRRQRNFKFKTPVFELSALGVVNLFGKNYAERGFSPYLLVGAGVSFVNVTRDYSQLNTELYHAESDLQAGLNQDINRRLPRAVPVFPVGLGIRYAINYKWVINFESSYRYSLTDYLDGFSKSAGPENPDSYHGHSIGLIYRLGWKNMSDCPPVAGL